MSFSSKVCRFGFAGLAVTGVGFMLTGIIIDGTVQFWTGALMGVTAIALLGFDILASSPDVKVEIHEEQIKNFVNRDVAKLESNMTKRHMRKHVVRSKMVW